jgi:hypothetical protein
VSEIVRNSLVQASRGFPYFIHMLLQKCVEIILDRNKQEKNVTYTDYKRALDMASREAYRAHTAKLADVVSSPDSLEHKIVIYIAMQRASQIKTATILQIAARHLDIPQKNAEERVRAAIRKLRDDGIIYVDKAEKSVGFIGPIIKLFIAENFRITHELANPLTAHQQSLL